LVNGKEILIRSAQYSIAITMINVILCIIISLASSGGLEPNQISGNLGNFTLLESVVLFLTGAYVGWANTDRIVASYEGEDPTIARVPDGRGGWFVALISRRRILSREDDGGKIERAFDFILCGAILFVETVALALFSGY
jgi:hypothetical protein